MEGSNVPSLVNICLDEIVGHFEFFSVYLEQQENLGLKHLLQFQWTKPLFEKMSSAFRTKYASFFMNPYLKELDFTKFSLIDINEETCEICDAKIRSDDQQADDNAEKRGKKTLKHQHEGALLLTRLGTCTQVRKVLVSLRLADMLPHTLESLRLDDIEGLDKVLECVGTKCSNLQELALYNCKSVTDTVITDLFSEDRPINSVLRKLNLMGTSVTTEGILIALERCQNLVELLHLELGCAVSSSYHNQIANKTWPLMKYNLEKMITPSTYLQECIELCPGVEALILESVTDQTDGLVLCGKFKRLTKLHVHGMPVSLSSFLEILGPDLKVLGIYAYCTFSVQTLVEFCPNIKQLNLYNPNFERNEDLKIDVTQFSLQDLGDLYICSANCVVDSQDIGDIFSVSPNLKSITFYEVTGISIEFMNFLAMCGIALVETLNIWCCDASVLSLRKFIVAAPNLKYLSVRNCINISKEQCAEFEQLKKDLTVYYHDDIVMGACFDF